MNKPIYTIFAVRDNKIKHTQQLSVKPTAADLHKVRTDFATQSIWIRESQEGVRLHKWERVTFIYSVDGQHLKKAKVFKSEAAELPKILQMLVLIGAA